MNTIDVIGVGRAVMDYAVLVTKHPVVDQKTEALDRFYGSGSPIPNALCQLAGWGWSTSLVAVVGDDRDGEEFLSCITSCCVNVDHVTRREGQPTPRAFLWVEKGSGRRTVVLDRALAPLSPRDLPSKELDHCRFLLADGYEADANLEAMERVRKAGGEVMIDAGSIRDKMDEQLAICDWIIVPLAFAKAYYGNTDLFEVARDLKSRGAKAAVVTNGAAGCVAAWGDNTEWFRSYPMETVVDTTGAGDLYHAGFLHGLLKGWAIPSCIRWASATGALATTAFGGRGKMPSCDEVEELLNREEE